MDISSNSCGIVLSRWMSPEPTDGESTMFHVMAWCRQAPSHYLKQCWLRSLSPYGVTKPRWAKLRFYEISFAINISLHSLRNWNWATRIWLMSKRDFTRYDLKPVWHQVLFICRYFAHNLRQNIQTAILRQKYPNSHIATQISKQPYCDKNIQTAILRQKYPNSHIIFHVNKLVG